MALKKFIFLSMVSLFSSQLIAQDTSGTRQEIWPEVNLYYKLNDRFRIYAKYSATKLRYSSYTDGGFGIYLDYFAYPVVRKRFDANSADSTAGYFLWLRAGYMYSTTPPEVKDPFQLHTFVTEANVRFHLPYDILLTNQNRFDWRIIDGNLEPRYRPRLTFEKYLHTRYMYFTPDIYGEYYIYFNDGKLNRFRLSAGIQTKVTSHIEFKTYYVHQFDNGHNVSSLNALGLELKFYLNHKEIKSKFSGKKKT